MNFLMESGEQKYLSFDDLRPDFSEVRFAEVKRMDTNDRLNEAQIRGLAVLKLLYGCEVDIFYVVEEGKDVPERSVIWEC
jgi:hypothetical protein